MKRFFITDRNSWRYLLTAVTALFAVGFSLFPLPNAFRVMAAATISGKVFRDINGNGIADAGEPGISGVTVNVFAPTATAVTATATTANDGTYTVSPTDTGNTNYRIEFVNYPAYLAPSPRSTDSVGGGTTTDSGSTVQFVTATSTNVNLPLMNPNDYASANPKVAIATHRNGSGVGRTEPGIASAPFNSDGVPTAQGGSALNPNTEATLAQVGAVWGLAHQKTTKRLFSSAIMQRHIGFGPRGIGGVYVTQYASSGSGTLLGDFTLQGIAPSNGGSAIDLGTTLRTTVTGAVAAGTAGDNQLSSDVAQPNRDIDAYTKAGTTAFGGIDITEDNRYLWLVNLNQRALIRVDLNRYTPAVSGTIAAANVAQYPLSSATGLPTCTNGVFRPWALKFKDGFGYLGGVCSAENTGGTAANLSMNVLRFSPSAPTVFTSVVNRGLVYTREKRKANSFNTPTDEASAWQPWSSGVNVNVVQPILTDIEFDANGSMIIGLADRSGFQKSSSNYQATSGTTTADEGVFAAGDIVHFCKNPATSNYVAEGATEGAFTCTESDTGEPTDTNTGTSNGAYGALANDGLSNTGEFYYGDYFDGLNSTTNTQSNHLELSTGGLGVRYGTLEVINGVYDPVRQTDANLGIFTNGWHAYSTTNGARNRRYQLIPNGSANGTLGKANGIGDIEVLTENAPIEIGNRVWNDANKNGIQDAGESPIANVTVQLYEDTDGDGVAETLSGTATTDANGEYYFGGLNKTNITRTVSCGAVTSDTRIVASTDDAEQVPSTGVMNLTSVDMDLSYDPQTAVQQINGLRFANANIPKGATITGAYVQFTARNDNPAGGISTGSPAISITGENSSASATFTTTANNISSRTATSAVSWTPTAWTGGTTYNSADLTAIVQALVNRSDWTATSPVTIFMQGDATTNFRSGWAFDGAGTGDEPRLVVTYETQCAADIQPSRAYQVRIPSSNFNSGQPLNAFSPTTANATTSYDSGNSALRDSNGTVSGTNVVANLTTDALSGTTHTVDFGFATATYSLGNRLWFDTNNNGLIDATEVGIGNASISVFLDANADGAPDNLASPLQTLTTDSSGFYRFDGLAANSYVVRVNPSNFQTGGALVGYTSSATTETAANSDVDLNDNGLNPASANNPLTATNGVLSSTVTLGASSEPTTDAQTAASGTFAGQGGLDQQANMSVDFGFYRLQLAGTVWRDTGAGVSNNGILNAGESGISNVTMRLYAANGTTEIPVGPDGILGTADDQTGTNNKIRTDSQGNYTFSGLPPGDYVVKIVSFGLVSSTLGEATDNDPDNNTDSDDNGRNGTVANGNNGFIFSLPITLTANGEPTVTNATATTLNSTVDFGIVTVPTAVKLIDFKAFTDGNGTVLKWQSGMEVDNLGYRVWRETDGKRTAVNSELIAGSALQVGEGMPLTAGQGYAWRDADSQSAQSYWLEAVDLDGTSEFFGPVNVENASYGNFVRSSTFEELGKMASLSEQREYIGKSKQTKSAQAKSSSNLAVETANNENPLADDAKAVKIEIANDGWTRVSLEQLASAGFDINAPTESWQMFVENIEIPLGFTKKGIEFFARASRSTQTDGKVYWLTIGKEGKRLTGNRYEFNKETQPSWFMQSVEKRDRLFRANAILNGERENFYSALVTTSGSNQNIFVHDVAAEQSNARIFVAMQGFSSAAHETDILLNGASIGRIGGYTGRTRKEMTFEVASNLLREGRNELVLRSVANGDITLLESIRVTYPRQTKVFENYLTMTQRAGQALRIDGLTSKYVRVLDITDERQPVWAQVEPTEQPDGTFAFTLDAASAERIWEIQPNDKAVSPRKIEMNEPSEVRHIKRSAQFVIVTPKAFAEQAEVLAKVRRMEGLTVQIVRTEDIYDEYSFGERSATAIKSLLADYYARGLRYTLLLGDATVDPRNYTGAGGANFDQVPTMITETAFSEIGSDQMLGDFNEDGKSEIVIGRLPARTEADAARMIAKQFVTDTPQTASQRGALWVSDNADGQDFVQANTELMNLTAGTINGRQIKRADGDASQLRETIISAFNSAPLFVNYLGHGSAVMWTNGGILKAEDAARMGNGKRQPFVVALTCWNGAFAEPFQDSMAEAFLKTTGGARGVLASSSMNYASEQTALATAFFAAMTNGGTISDARLGDVIQFVRASEENRDVRLSVMLFGDPTARLVAKSETAQK